MNKWVSTKESVDALNPGAGDLPVPFGLHEKIPAGSLRLNVATKKGCAVWVSTCSLRSENPTCNFVAMKYGTYHNDLVRRSR